MSETSIQVRPNPAPVLPAAPAPPRVERFRYVRAALKALASLRLTVILFALSMILVFCGTLAMMDNGLWAALTQYFRSFLAWIPLQVFVRFGQVFFGLPADWSVAGSFPFPGGWTLGAALMVNLIAAHLVRFKLSWKRAGVLVLHSGLILLMIGELVTGLFAVEGTMLIPVGGSTGYVENLDRVELAFVWPDDEKTEDGAAQDNVVVVPGSILRKGGVIHDDRLPADVEVVRYLPNSTQPRMVSSDVDNLATRGFGLRMSVQEQLTGRGVDADQKRDIPSVFVALRDKNSGASLGTYLVSVWLSPPYVMRPQEVEIDGRTYEIALRQQRTYRPYSFHLKELKHDTYRGTGIAKNYSSLVKLTDAEAKENRDVLIYMNHPLFYRGETFYQSQVLGGGTYTVLAVVRNPGWVLPYISCFLVALGMIVHFSLHLLGFLQKVTR
ncbi:MAG TPA: cytochrome c biogenesis protein ResB [Gemmataceae bacterium]